MDGREGPTKESGGASTTTHHSKTFLPRREEASYSKVFLDLALDVRFPQSVRMVCHRANNGSSPERRSLAVSNPKCFCIECTRTPKELQNALNMVDHCRLFGQGEPNIGRPCLMYLLGTVIEVMVVVLGMVWGC